MVVLRHRLTAYFRALSLDRQVKAELRPTKRKSAVLRKSVIANARPALLKRRSHKHKRKLRNVRNTAIRRLEQAPKQLHRRFSTRKIGRLVVTQKRKRAQFIISPANKQLARMHRYFARAKRRARRCRIPGGHVTFKVRRPLSLLPATPFSVFHFVKFLKIYRSAALGATTRRYRQDKLVELQCTTAKALSARAVSTQLRRKLKHR